MMAYRYPLIKEEFLYRGGENVNEYVKGLGWRWAILHFACEEMDWEFIVWLVLYCGADVNLLTDIGNNPLYFTSNASRLYNFLVWQGCDPYYLHAGYSYDLQNETIRIKILRMINHSAIHKDLQDCARTIYGDLWREVAEWIFADEE